MSTLRSLSGFGLVCLTVFFSTIVSAENLNGNISTNVYPWPNAVILVLFLGIILISVASGFISSTKYLLEPVSLAISIGLVIGVLFGAFTNEITVNHLVTLIVLGASIGFITNGEASTVMGPVLFLMKIALTVTIGMTTIAAIQHAGFLNAMTLVVIYVASALLAYGIFFYRKNRINIGGILSNL